MVVALRITKYGEFLLSEEFHEMGGRPPPHLIYRFANLIGQFNLSMFFLI